MNVTVDECLKEKGSLEREFLELIETIEQNDLTYEVLKPMMLMNITHSLAVIADAIGERNSSEFPNNCEPQTDCGDFADRLAYERGVKHAWEVAQKVFNSTVTFYEAEDVAKQIDKDINVRSKDEPQTERKNLCGKQICDHLFDDDCALKTDCAWK